MRIVFVTEVARTWPRLVPLRTKLTTGKPKPKFANPLPVIVKLASGEARSIGLGVMALTIVLVPVTVADAPAPPVKVTFPAKVPKEVGLKRTVTV